MSSKWLMKQQMLEQQERQKTIADLSEVVELVPIHDSAPTPPDQIYKWVIGDNIWQVAQRLQFDPYQLLEHNDIEDYNGIEPGFELHLPEPRAVDMREPIRYELFENPKQMHVIHEGGTHKVVFGNIREWSDIKPTGTLYPNNRNVTVEGIAHVPIGDETAAFYMDKLALGDYLESGRVRYTVGFNHAHLADGHVDQFAPKVKPALKKTIKKLEQKIAEDAMKEGVPAKLEEPSFKPNEYKTTFKPFNEQRIPVIFELMEDVIVDEYDTVRPSKRVLRGTTVSVLGTFQFEGKTYGRPTNTNYWFGIPMDKVRPMNEDDDEDDEVYNTNVELSDRVAMGIHGRLSPWEKWVQVPTLKVASYYVKTRDWMQNKQNNKEH